MAHIKDNTVHSAIEHDVWAKNRRSYRLLALMLIASGIVSVTAISFALKFI